MKRLIVIFFVLNSIITLGQTEDRINQVRELYKDYNENLSNMDTYEIKLNTAGSYPSLTIYTDFGDKLMFKAGDSDEFGSSSTEYYFFKDTVQFIFSKSERLLTHWGADIVRFEMIELRFYFDRGQVIKALKKQFKGIENQDEPDLTAIPNKTIDYMEDSDSNWSFYKEKLSDFMRLYADLEQIF